MEIEATAKLGDSPNKAGAKRAVAKHKAEACSGVTNGRDVLPGVDGRSLIARRYHDIQAALVVDQGGADRISEARLQLIRRFSAAACIAEDLEAKLVRGEEIDISEHALLVSTMVRVANKIGINRIAKQVPDLDTFLAEKKARARALQAPVEVEA